MSEVSAILFNKKNSNERNIVSIADIPSIILEENGCLILKRV